MPGPVGGGRSGGGGGIGGGARGGGFSGGSHGGFSSGSNRTFRSGVPRGTGSFFTDSPDNPNGEEDTKKRFRNMIILVIFLAVFAGGPVISMVGNLFSDLASPSPDIWAEVDSVIVMDEEPLFDIESVPRARLDESLCKPVDVWYFDMAELFEPEGEGEMVEHALSYFYEKTGVQPLLVTANYIDGTNAPSWDTVENYLYNLYIDMFGEDEGHYIFLYFEHSDTTYTAYYIPGLDAMEVMDDEASSILMDYLEWYYQVSPSWGQMFASAFADTADTIMYVPEEYTSAVIADPDYAEVSTYPPASTVPAVEVDSSEVLTSPVVALTSEPDSAVVEDMTAYTEESTTEILWDDDITEEPEEDFISDEALGAVFVVALAVTAFVVFVLWNRRKMRRLEEDM